MKKIIFLIITLISNLVNAQEFTFILSCKGSEKNADIGFFFIGKKTGAEVIYPQTRYGKIIAYKGGENIQLKLTVETTHKFEYAGHVNSMGDLPEGESTYKLDRSSLWIIETIKYKNDNSPSSAGYQCSREKNEVQTYQNTMELKKKYQTGKYNKI